VPNHAAYVKDGIDDAVVHGARGAVNPAGVGTKVAAYYRNTVAPGETWTVLLRLSSKRLLVPFADALRLVAARRAEADEFYAYFAHGEMPDDARLVQRQALAGLLWSKQFYRYDVERWLNGDPAFPAPPADRLHGRNHAWRHLNNADVIAMPDTWEYPWYAVLRWPWWTPTSPSAS
jgi:hypothetical protein